MSTLTRLTLLVILLDVLSPILLCYGQNTDLQEENRGKKKGKYDSLLIAALVLKAIIVPIAFKAMAFMSTIAVVLSVLSLLTSSVLGYTKVATSEHYPPAHRHVYIPRYKKRNDHLNSEDVKNNDVPDVTSDDSNEDDKTKYIQNNPGLYMQPYYYSNFK